MRKIKVLSLLWLLTQVAFLYGQNSSQIIWRDPINFHPSAVEGQAWSTEVQAPYDRLPERAKALISKPLWRLSQQSAGLDIRFRTNANNIFVRYQVGGVLALTHMPATSVSGVDLYAVNEENKFFWCAGKRSFGDTVIYRFSGIDPSPDYTENGLEYRLYLPLYNSVKQLQIGISDKRFLEFLPARNDKPIVVYGTSIAQGACASRPGMAWTAILGRKLVTPMINLGFSGNGKLEKEMIDLMAEIDAKIYILDCLPNMTAPRFNNEEVRKRILESVIELQQKKPGVPILFVEHDGYTDGFLRPDRYKNYYDINVLMRKAFSEMIANGVQNIFLLPRSELNMDSNCQVDGVHPNDLGMLRYASAYEKYIRKILKK